MYCYLIKRITHMTRNKSVLLEGKQLTCYHHNLTHLKKSVLDVSNGKISTNYRTHLKESAKTSIVEDDLVMTLEIK